jgi:predicted  nucleic acid-binding Zn-ribbon protein
MTDIVERLRGKPVRHDYFPEADRQEAAAEIERLRDEIERLRDELETWKDRYHAEHQDHEATMKAWDEERSGL